MGSLPVYSFPARAFEGTNFTKQSYEEFFVSVDFIDAIADGDFLVLHSSSVTAIDLTTGADATAIVLDIATVAVIKNTDGILSILEVLVKAGTNTRNYKITYKGVTNLSQKWECDLVMRIRDI